MNEMPHSWLSYFVDPVLRAPTLGSMLMGLSAGLIGTIAVLRREALVGEALSHAAYPGLIAGMLVAGLLFPVTAGDDAYALAALVGGTVTALASIAAIHAMQKRLRIPADAALCFILAATFGIGVTLASHLQFTDAVAYRRSTVLLYGQAATMTDFHVLLYAILALVIALSLTLLYKEIQLITFDRPYALSLGIAVKSLEAFLFFLLTVAVIIGIRTVGVVLMSAMLIAPPVAARQFTDRLAPLLWLSAFLGLVAGFYGNYFSTEASQLLMTLYPDSRLTLPTGPMISLTAAVICLAALLFAPQRGLLGRLWRIARFRYSRLQENILKFIWHTPGHHTDLAALSDYLGARRLYLSLALRRLRSQGWLTKADNSQWHLTTDGEARAAKIVRLHRLWEVYLADYLGIGAERVHRSAEEMEHIITPSLERELTALLADPKVDPHHQPIPPPHARW